MLIKSVVEFGDILDLSYNKTENQTFAPMISLKSYFRYWYVCVVPRTNILFATGNVDILDGSMTIQFKSLLFGVLKETCISLWRVDQTRKYQCHLSVSVYQTPQTDGWVRDMWWRQGAVYGWVGGMWWRLRAVYGQVVDMWWRLGAVFGWVGDMW